MAQINKPAQPLVPPTTDADVENIVAEAIASDDTHASLVNGEVPSDQLPSYVDDVLEFESTAAFPAEGEVGKIYVALDTNYTYRWSGTAYVQVGGSGGEVTLTPKYAIDEQGFYDWETGDPVDPADLPSTTKFTTIVEISLLDGLGNGVFVVDLERHRDEREEFTGCGLSTAYGNISLNYDSTAAEPWSVDLSQYTVEGFNYWLTYNSNFFSQNLTQLAQVIYPARIELSNDQFLLTQAWFEPDRDNGILHFGEGHGYVTITPNTDPESEDAYILDWSHFVIAPETGMTNPMTAAGDLIVGGSAGAPTRLAAGSNGQVLGISSGVPAWVSAAAGDGTPHYFIENNDLVDEAGQPVDITSFNDPTTVLLTITIPNNDPVYDVGELESIPEKGGEGQEVGGFDHLEVRTNHGLISITQTVSGDPSSITNSIDWSDFQAKKPQYWIDEENVFVDGSPVPSLSDLPNQQNGQTIDLILFLPSDVTKTTEARMRWSLDSHGELDHVLVQTLKYGDIILRQNPDTHSENPILIDWSESYVFYDSPIISLNFNENLVEDMQHNPLNLAIFGSPSHVTIALNTGNDVLILIPAVITANEGAWMILAGEHGTIIVTPNTDPKSQTPYILDWSNFSYHPELCLVFTQDADDVSTFPAAQMPDLIPISVPMTFTAVVTLTSGSSLVVSAVIVPQENAWMVVLGDHGSIALAPNTETGDGYIVDWSNFTVGGDSPSPEPFDPSTLPTLTIHPSGNGDWHIDEYPTDLPQTLPLGPLTPNIKLLLRLDDDNIEEQFGIMLSDQVTIHLLDDQFNLLPEAKLVLGESVYHYELYTSHILACSDYQTQLSNSPFLHIGFAVCNITDGEEIVYTPGE